MRPFRRLKQRRKPRAFKALLTPILKRFKPEKALESKGYRPLQMSFDDQLKALIFFHLQEYSSGRELIQALEQNDFAKECVAPPKGIQKSAFFEAINTRGLEQLGEVFEHLVKEAGGVIPAEYAHLGNLVVIDGSLIDAVLSMEWADYRSGKKKAKAHIGFDVNRGIPRKIFLTDGKEGERPFVDKIIDKGETAVIDRGYQSHAHFDKWQIDEKQFVCRIQEGTTKTVVKENAVPENSIVFYDAVVLLGTKGTNQTKEELRLVGYHVDGKDFWIATNRHDLSSEEVAQVYKLRWNIETFFGWWKRHLKVYHLIARSEYGLMVQILGGLITYLLLAIYCREQHNESVSIKRVRELRNQIANDAAEIQSQRTKKHNKSNKIRKLKRKRRCAKN
ncbi:MAG: IS4 family transposase [Bacillota bacterium]|nr:IS4 family transposase [Bacillota bacterium]